MYFFLHVLFFYWFVTLLQYKSSSTLETSSVTSDSHPGAHHLSSIKPFSSLLPLLHQLPDLVIHQITEKGKDSEKWIQKSYTKLLSKNLEKNGI